MILSTDLVRESEATMTRSSEVGIAEEIAIRCASVEDAKTIAAHRRAMFHDMGYHDKVALDSMMADVTPRRLPRNQPRDGVALGGGAGDAGAEGDCGGEGACPDRAWPRFVHWRRSAGGSVSRHGAAPWRRSAFPSPPFCPGWESSPWCGITTRAGSA